MVLLWDQVFNLARKSGAKYPELVAAQWALESGYGSTLSGKNNFFGIKGSGTKQKTKEFLNGQWVTIVEEFEDFETPGECIQYLIDRWYKDFKQFKGVNNAPNKYEAARELVRQGYATAPDYADKLIRIMNENASTKSTSTTILAKKMIGPTKKPQDFGFKAGDHHIIVNDSTETAKAYDFNGKLLWELPCLARGQGSDYEHKLTNTDTPPGLYRVGAVYKDYDQVGSDPPYDRTLMAYGWYSFDLEELENQEQKYGRAGIMLHGGGSACGWPGAWAPMQRLYSTYGCVRMHNKHLRENVLPLLLTGKIYVSVYQEG
jgi:hypothetical protein